MIIKQSRIYIKYLFGKNIQLFFHFPLALKVDVILGMGLYDFGKHSICVLPNGPLPPILVGQVVKWGTKVYFTRTHLVSATLTPCNLHTIG